jgi:hypothetical protein
MTGKPTMIDDEGPGMRAERARKRRMVLFMILYAVVAIAFMVGIRLATPEPVALSHRLTPNVALATAVLFPLLFGGAMVIIWRMLDEVAHRIALWAWAIAFVVNAFATISWAFLWQGGWAPQPSAMALLVGSAVVVMIAAWVKQRL